MKVRLLRIALGFILMSVFFTNASVARAQLPGGRWAETPCQWIDLSSNPGQTRLSLGDDDFQSVDLSGLGFFFFGEPLTEIKISSNGYITYGDNKANKWRNDPLVDLTDPNQAYPGDPASLIAPFWDDLNPPSGGAVYYLIDMASTPGRFIVEWQDIPLRGAQNASNTVTFEAILYAGSNEIVFQYKDVPLTTDSATVGLKYNNQIAQQYAYNDQNALRDEMAISFATSEIYTTGVEPTEHPQTGEPPEPQPYPTCIQPPTVEPISPVQNQTGVSLSPDITLKITYGCAGLDRSSIHLYVNNTEVTQSTDISGYPDEYTLRYHCLQPFDCGQLVTVRLEAADLADPANIISPPYEYSFTTIGCQPEQPSVIACDQPPVIEDITPAPNSTDVPVDSQIAMSIKSACDDLNSIHLVVDGQDVTNKADIAGTPNSYTLTYNPDRPFECSTIIPVSIEATDLAGRKATRSYFLYVRDSCEPYLLSSEPDQACVSDKPTFTFAIKDIGTGLDSTSLRLIVNGVEVSDEATITPNEQANTYTISYTPTTPLEGKILVRVVAKDLATPANVLDTSLEYTVCSHEWSHYQLNASVSDMALDKNGQLWIATSKGLFTFAPNLDVDPSDPNYWSDWANQAYALQDCLITCLAADHQGYLWLGTQPDSGAGGKIVKFDPVNGSVIQVFQKGQSGLPDDIINDIAVDANDAVWVATQEAGVVRLQNQQWQVMFDAEHGLTDNWVKAIVLDETGDKWVATMWGDIYEFDSANQLIYNSANDDFFPSGYALNINSITFDSVENALWVASTEGAYKYQAGQWSVINSDLYPELASNEINSVLPLTAHEYPGEKYWLATNEGIFATTDWSSWKSYTEADPWAITNHHINCIQEDSYGNLWFGTDSGVSRLDITPPAIAEISPDDLNNFGQFQDLTVSFTEPMDWDSLVNNITVSPNPNFTTQCSPYLTSINFIPPDEGLTPNTTYKVTIGQKTMDISGNQLGSSQIITFTAREPEQARVTGASTANHETGVEVSRKIIINFNKPVDPSSIKNVMYVYILGTSEQIKGSISWNSDYTQLTFSPEKNLRYDTDYGVEIRQGGKDQQGSPLAAYNFQFKTESSKTDNNQTNNLFSWWRQYYTNSYQSLLSNWDWSSYNNWNSNWNSPDYYLNWLSYNSWRPSYDYSSWWSSYDDYLNSTGGYFNDYFSSFNWSNSTANYGAWPNWSSYWSNYMENSGSYY